MTFSKQDLYAKAVNLLKRIPYYDSSKFKIHLEYTTYDMIPSISICENEYHLDIYERGQLIFRETTEDARKVLYWIIEYSISLYAHKTIWEKHSNSSTRSLTYTDPIRQEEREIKLNSFKYIGDVYFEWYYKAVNQNYHNHTNKSVN